MIQFMHAAMASTSGSSSSKLFLGTLPNLSHLEAFEGRTLNCDSLPAVKAKCREIVRADSLVMCAPAKALRQTISLNIRIVAKKGHITSDARAQQRLASANIKVIGAVPVCLELVLVCYRFTLTARLAPKWNVVGDWIVKGCDIFETGRGQALKLDVGMTTKEITISVSAYKLTINFLKPEDLEVSTCLLNQFKKESDMIIKEMSISGRYDTSSFGMSIDGIKYLIISHSHTCSFTQAHIFSASHSVPTSGTIGFDSYDKIRLHWKKQYGFILPESQNLFYQVYFKVNPGIFFSYPGCCTVTGSRPIVCPSKNADQLAASFVNDIHSRMPSFCGQQIVFSMQPFTPLNALQTVPQISSHSNITPIVPPVPSVKPPIARTMGDKQPELGKPNLPPLLEHLPRTLLPSVDKRSGTAPPLHSNDDATVPSYTARPTNRLTPSKPIPRPIPTPSRPIPTPSRPIPTNSRPASTLSRSIPTNNKRPTTPLSMQSSSKRICNQVRSNDHLVPSLGSNVELSNMLPTSYEGDSSKGQQTTIVGTRSCNEQMKMFNKMKIADIKLWLKQKGVAYNSKEKKDELLRKVEAHLQCTVISATTNS